MPLVTAADGTKFRKSTGGGSPWLDPEMTSPYAWYQYFVNTADADVVRYLRWFTFLAADRLAEVGRGHRGPAARAGRPTPAGAELTALVHGETATAAVEHASVALFGRGDLDRLDESTLSAALRARRRWPNFLQQGRRHHRPPGGDGLPQSREWRSALSPKAGLR